MFFFAHLAAGLLLGKLTGSYTWALMGAFFPDVDHLFSYVRHGLLWRPKRLWKALIREADPWGDQRNFLHTVFLWVLISGAFLLIDFRIGLVFSLGYLSHLALDALDSADYYPFYPSKQITIRGPIGYFSWKELVFTILLFGLFFTL